MRAMPSRNVLGVGGSMKIALPKSNTSLLLHIHPVEDRETEIRSRQVAGLLLIVSPQSEIIVDTDVVAATLNLTRMESKVAVLLAGGKSVREIAAETGRKENTIRHHIKNIFAKHKITRQSELVGLVLSLTNAHHPPR